DRYVGDAPYKRNEVRRCSAAAADGAQAHARRRSAAGHLHDRLTTVEGCAAKAFHNVRARRRISTVHRDYSTLHHQRVGAHPELASVVADVIGEQGAVRNGYLSGERGVAIGEDHRATAYLGETECAGAVQACAV